MIPLFPDFAKLELDHRDEVIAVTGDYSLYSDYNFTSLWCYNVEDDIVISRLRDNLVVRFRDYVTGEPFYSFCGGNDVPSTIETLLSHAQKEELTPVLKLVPEMNIPSHSDVYAHFHVEDDEENSDYILSVDDFCELQGNKYRNIRWLVGKFMGDHPNYESVTLDLSDPSVQTQIYDLFYKWEKGRDKQREETQHELVAIERLLSCCHIFDLLALGVYLEKELIGLSISELATKKYAIAHFEKADPSYRGLYQLLKTLTSKRLRVEGCLYLNIEQDLGIPGLKRAKLNLRPIHYLKKHRISYLG